MRGFQDHFSTGSAGYAAFRPRYPDALYRYLAELAPARNFAWDCATGNGQAAVGLAPWFIRVVATDASAGQLEHAEPRDNVEYRRGSAEASGLPSGVADLITVAQAAHWFDRPRFFVEAKRVGRPGAVLALWMYNLARIVPEIDQRIDRFYRETVGPYWPGDRVLIDQEYRSIDLPYPEITPPTFAMSAEWSLPHLLGYLRTWSAVARYHDAEGVDPVLPLATELERLWGDPAAPRRVVWPLSMRVARL